jgi:hypothetical protein
MRDTLRHLVHACHGDGALSGCPIIEAVVEPKAGPKTRARRAA